MAAARAVFLPGSGASSSLPLEGTWEQVSPWLGLAWLVGVAGCSIRLLGGWLITARLRSATARLAPVEWQARLAPLMKRMGVLRRVSLRASTRIEAPMAMGWLRPVILVPVGALAGLSTEQVEGLLAHELAHIRRHDYLVNLLQSLAEAVLFYHPAVWWVSRQIRTEREHCCDDLAVAATGATCSPTRALWPSWNLPRGARAGHGGHRRLAAQSHSPAGEPVPGGGTTIPGGSGSGSLRAALLIAAGRVAAARRAPRPHRNRY